MFEKDLTVTLLYDLYAPMLSEKKKEVFEAYYQSDLSLAEIAEETGTSRQAVRDLIGRTKAELIRYEEKIGLIQKRKELLSLCEELERLGGEDILAVVKKLRDII